MLNEHLSISLHHLNTIEFITGYLEITESFIWISLLVVPRKEPGHVYQSFGDFVSALYTRIGYQQFLLTV